MPRVSQIKASFIVNHCNPHSCFSKVQHLFLTFLCSSVLVASAQTVAATNDQPYRLDTVVVLGNPADAPVEGASVSVLSGATLTERGITSVRELTALTPNLATFDANGDRTPRFSLRGLRENNFSYGQSAAAIYVDDVPYSDLYTRGVPLFDIYSGEFYRGPQPTLFGANRPGGVLNLMTRLPSNEWHGRAGVSYGNYNAIGVEAGIGGPVANDKLSFGVSGVFNQRDGYFENLVTGNDPDQHETLAGRAQLRWTPTDRLDFTLSAAADRFRDGGVIVRPLDAPGDLFDVKYHQDGHNHQESQTYALRGAWTGEQVKAVSVTSWRRWQQDVSGDFDFAEFFSANNFPLNGLDGFAMPKVKQWSQEVRLESLDQDAKLKWNGGVYWSELTTDFASGYVYGPLAPVVVSPSAPSAGTDLTSGRNRNENVAVFAQGTYSFCEALDLTAGLRYEFADVHGNRNHTFDGFPIAAPQSYSTDFNSLQPSAVLTWRFAPKWTAWAKFATGFQPGGFSSSSDNSSVTQYGAAESLHYEIGVSAKLWDDKLIASATGFWIDTHNYQVYRPVVTFDGVSSGLDFYILNARQARTIGGELELRALPCEFFEFRLAGGFQNAEFRDFTTPGPFSQNFAGNDINFVPEFTMDASMTARTKCGFYATLGVTAVGQYWFDEGNTEKQDAFALLYARAGWQRKNFSVSVFGRNLTDTKYYANALDLGPRSGPSSFFVGTPGDPLMFGGQVDIKF